MMQMINEALKGVEGLESAVSKTETVGRERPSENGLVSEVSQ